MMKLQIPSYSPELVAGTLSLAAVNQLHPAQLALGYREVAHRIQQFQAMTPDQLDAYLLEHFLPIVIAPDRLPYVVDHHHRSHATMLTQGQVSLDYGGDRPGVSKKGYELQASETLSQQPLLPS